ncbi:MAG: thioesterase domain-containing protein, partial [Anaerolineales bacterium]
ILLRVRRKTRLARKLREQSNFDDARVFDAADFIDFADTLPRHRQQLIMRHYEAKQAYHPQPYDGRVTLFRATTRPLLSTFDPAAGWRELVPGRLEVVDISGSHEGMFKKPHVTHLAERLKSCIDRVANQK